jgi:hypothetical protein
MVRAEIEHKIYKTFDQLMEQSENLILEKSSDCPLASEFSALDSLSLVNFLLTLEANLNEGRQNTVTLMTPELILNENKPLKNVGSLLDYLEKLEL